LYHLGCLILGPLGPMEDMSESPCAESFYRSRFYTYTVLVLIDADDGTVDGLDERADCLHQTEVEVDAVTIVGSGETLFRADDTVRPLRCPPAPEAAVFVGSPDGLLDDLVPILADVLIDEKCAKRRLDLFDHLDLPLRGNHLSLLSMLGSAPE